MASGSKIKKLHLNYGFHSNCRVGNFEGFGGTRGLVFCRLRQKKDHETISSVHFLLGEGPRAYSMGRAEEVAPSPATGAPSLTLLHLVVERAQGHFTQADTSPIVKA